MFVWLRAWWRKTVVMQAFAIVRVCMSKLMPLCVCVCVSLCRCVCVCAHVCARARYLGCLLVYVSWLDVRGLRNSLTWKCIYFYSDYCIMVYFANVVCLEGNARTSPLILCWFLLLIGMLYVKNKAGYLQGLFKILPLWECYIWIFLLVFATRDVRSWSYFVLYEYMLHCQFTVYTQQWSAGPLLSSFGDWFYYFVHFFISHKLLLWLRGCT